MTDPTFTIVPLCWARMIGMTARMSRMGATTFVSRMSCVEASSVMIVCMPPTPAMFRSASIRPPAVFASSMILTTSLGLVTSAVIAMIDPPAALISLVRAERLDARRPTMTTVQSRLARCRAVARPMPLEAPVTIATLRGVVMS